MVQARQLERGNGLLCTGSLTRTALTMVLSSASQLSGSHKAARRALLSEIGFIDSFPAFRITSTFEDQECPKAGTSHDHCGPPPVCDVDSLGLPTDRSKLPDSGGHAITCALGKASKVKFIRAS